MANSKSLKICDIEYELASTFVFECKDNISKAKYKIHKEALNEILIEITREFRRAPVVGMKQPTPPGAMLGWDGALVIKNKGQIAAGYKWKLYCGGKLIQEERTDEKGESSLELDFPSTRKVEYKLEVFAPVINKKDESGNKLPEESNAKPNSGSNPTTPVRDPQPTV